MRSETQPLGLVVQERHKELTQQRFNRSHGAQAGKVCPRIAVRDFKILDL